MNALRSANSSLVVDFVKFQKVVYAESSKQLSLDGFKIDKMNLNPSYNFCLWAMYLFIFLYWGRNLCYLLCIASPIFPGHRPYEFAKCSGDRGPVPGRVIPNTFKIALDGAWLNIQHYKVRVKWSNSGNRVAPFPTPRYCSYWKWSLRVTLD